MVVSFARRLPPVIGLLIAVTLGMSLYGVVDARSGGDFYTRFALIPMDVWAGEVWRLVTWAVLDDNPVTLIYGAFMIYAFGGELVEAWGSRRFLAYVAAIVAVAAFGTSVFALAYAPAWDYPHFGGLVLGNALIVAWAYVYPDRQIRLYQSVDLGGPILAYSTVAMTLLYAVFTDALRELPDLVASAVALGYARRLTPAE